MYSYQNCTTLDRKYEFKTNFSKKILLISFQTTLQLQSSSKDHMCIRQCTLFTLKLLMCLKIKSERFHPLGKQASTIQMNSHCYKFGLVRHLTHCFSCLKKISFCPCRKHPKLRQNSGIILPQPCFEHTGNYVRFQNMAEAKYFPNFPSY